MKAESEVENTSTTPTEDMPNKNVVISESEIPNCFIDTSKRTLNCIQEGVLVDNEGQFISIGGDEKTCGDVEDNDGILRNGTLTSAPEGFSADASNGQDAAGEVGKRPFYHMISKGGT